MREYKLPLTRNIANGGGSGSLKFSATHQGLSLWIMTTPDTATGHIANRYREGVLEEGELITVLGKARWEKAESGQWSDSYGKVLVIGPTDKEPVYLSDDPETVKQLTVDS